MRSCSAMKILWAPLSSSRIYSCSQQVPGQWALIWLQPGFSCCFFGSGNTQEISQLLNFVLFMNQKQASAFKKSSVRLKETWSKACRISAWCLYVQIFDNSDALCCQKPCCLLEVFSILPYLAFVYQPFVSSLNGQFVCWCSSCKWGHYPFKGMKSPVCDGAF